MVYTIQLTLGVYQRFSFFQNFVLAHPRAAPEHLPSKKTEPINDLRSSRASFTTKTFYAIISYIQNYNFRKSQL